MNWRHHSSRVCDSNSRLTTWCDMQAVALFLEMVHLALTCLRQRLLRRVDGAQHAIHAAASISLDVMLHVEVPL